MNAFLIERCGLRPATSSQIGLVVHSSSDYFSPVGFPSVIDLGLRVNKLGNSSVTYEIGVFERGVEEVKAVGSFVHVFVDRQNRKPSASGMSESMRKGLGTLFVKDSSRL